MERLPEMMAALKGQFLLDPGVTFLNHGSFGACPAPVFEVYQRWQRELEAQPVAFLGRRITSLLAQARQSLSAYLNVPANDVVYFTNPTTAVNMVARSLDLQPGDEILATDHEYGAMDRTWRYLCRRSGARYINQPIPLPVATPQTFVEQLWAGVTEHTRVIFLSHITSPTALILPVEAICRRARQHGILTIIDGAHAPGQLPLHLADLGCDLYTGALHKWLCAPKGAAFLYARPEVQARLDPLVVSWGYESEKPGPSPFIDYHEWQGTRDLAAFLSVPAAIQFQQDNDWPQIQAACHRLASDCRTRLQALTGLPSICPDDSASPGYRWFAQMAAAALRPNPSARLPELDLDTLKTRLYDEYAIEVPLMRWQGQALIRVSYQAYNSPQDTDRLLEALQRLLPQSTPA
jgi:isopenicillin-N epimerase